MTFGKLSSPFIFDDKPIDNILEDIKENFYEVFMKRDVEARYLEGRFIFFSMNNKFKGVELKYPERFIHICSIKDKENYSIFPCHNDVTSLLCKSKCIHDNALTDFKLLSRAECPYRMARIHWIPEIINLAKNGDASIQTWTREKRDNGGNLVYKKYIRYSEGLTDYVIILKEDRKKNEVYKYDFITAFPLFYKPDIKRFDKMYTDYIEKAGSRLARSS